MRVEFLFKFRKDLDNIRERAVKDAVLRTIYRVEHCKRIAEIPNVKKLSGFKSAYRIRIGNYRIGIFVEADTVQFARVANRKDIYKVFP